MTKTCRGCGETKPLEAFYRRGNSGHRHRCKACQASTGKAYESANRERIAVRHSQWYRANKARVAANTLRWRQTDHGKDRQRENRLRLRYGLTSEKYSTLLALQGDCCAICRTIAPTHGRRLAVDHDHDTGAVRGLLCGPCNRAIGYLGDSPDRVAAALFYLTTARKHRQTA